MGWIIFFMIVSLILGIEVQEEDFPGVEYRLRVFLFFWMTSLG